MELGNECWIKNCYIFASFLIQLSLPNTTPQVTNHSDAHVFSCASSILQDYLITTVDFVVSEARKREREENINWYILRWNGDLVRVVGRQLIRMGPDRAV